MTARGTSIQNLSYRSMKKSLIKISILAALSLIAHGNDVNHINESILNDNQFIYADMNYDQNIDILDIVLIIDIILNN